MKDIEELTEELTKLRQEIDTQEWVTENIAVQLKMLVRKLNGDPNQSLNEIESLCPYCTTQCMKYVNKRGEFVGFKCDSCGKEID
jgi:tRNA(Ile2) C34 agmatinyltransferase TiaS